MALYRFRDPVKVQRMREGALRSFDARREFLDNLAAELGVPKPSSKADSISGTALPLPAHVTWAADAFVGLGLRFAWLRRVPSSPRANYMRP